jgi:hypothetical protein
MVAMSDEAFPPGVRAGALAMLAAGNTLRAVSEVFGVPVDVLAAWEQEDVDASRTNAVDLASAPVTHAFGAGDASLESRNAPGSTSNNNVGKAAVVLMLGVIGFMIWMVASTSIQDIRYARQGSPPMEQLQRVEGSVVRWVACSHPSKFSWRERVSLRGDSDTTDVSIPCVLPAGALSDGKPHRMAIRIRARAGHQYLVYDVALDGKTLLAYATVRQAVDDATSEIKFAAIVLTPLVIVFTGLLAAAMSIWRNPPRRVFDS